MIIFEQVTELAPEDQVAPDAAPDISVAELEEIAELQRAVLEVTEPTPMSYTLA